MESHTGALSRSHRYRNSSRRKSPVTTVQYRSFSLLSRGPVLLTCTQDGNLSFFRSDLHNVSLYFWSSSWSIDKKFGLFCSVALEVQGYLTLRCSLKLTPRIHSIRASFCPMLSLEKGEYIGLYVIPLVTFRLIIMCGLESLSTLDFNDLYKTVQHRWQDDFSYVWFVLCVSAF